MHDLFLELSMFCPTWQIRYDSIREAAKAAGVPEMLTNWLTTSDGMRYTSLMQGVPDTKGETERLKRLNALASTFSIRLFGMMEQRDDV